MRAVQQWFLTGINVAVLAPGLAETVDALAPTPVQRRGGEARAIQSGLREHTFVGRSLVRPSNAQGDC
jgi:hypothetical protein